MRWTADVEAGAWIRPRLGRWGTVGGVVPAGFPAYARVPHRAQQQRRVPDPGSGLGWRWEERPISWAEVADRLGRVAHPAMQWQSLTDGEGEPDLGEGWVAAAPQVGSAGLDLLADLAGLLPDGPAYLGVWSGYGGINGSSVRLTWRGEDAAVEQRGTFDIDPSIAAATEHGPLLELPGRRYVLFRGRVRELTEPGWTERAGLGEAWAADLPNLIWPADRSWLVGTEIDFDSTLVGGSGELIQRLLAEPRLESYPVRPDTDLTIDGDAVNGRPVD